MIPAQRLPINDLIVLLGERDDDTVTVDVGGILVDVDSVATDRGNIVLVLDPDDLRGTLKQVACGRDGTRRRQT